MSIHAKKNTFFFDHICIGLLSYNKCWMVGVQLRVDSEAKLFSKVKNKGSMRGSWFSDQDCSSEVCKRGCPSFFFLSVNGVRGRRGRRALNLKRGAQGRRATETTEAGAIVVVKTTVAAVVVMVMVVVVAIWRLVLAKELGSRLLLILLLLHEWQRSAWSISGGKTQRKMQ